jgi:hypothetical protein
VNGDRRDDILLIDQADDVVQTPEQSAHVVFGKASRDPVE